MHKCVNSTNNKKMYLKPLAGLKMVYSRNSSVIYIDSALKAVIISLTPRFRYQVTVPLFMRLLSGKKTLNRSKEISLLGNYGLLYNSQDIARVVIGRCLSSI